LSVHQASLRRPSPRGKIPFLARRACFRQEKQHANPSSAVDAAAAPERCCYQVRINSVPDQVARTGATIRPACRAEPRRRCLGAWRTLHFWRAAIVSTVARLEMISSSQARPRAIDLSSAARRSNLIGRTRCRSVSAGNRMSLNLLDGGLVHGISREGARSTAAQ